ncbi:MAG: SLC13 family permease [Acidobacteria bacterium]|jgi:di/tricarboxylate transporter|nr:SLC13 family permease [Acidobacteriota bacterium]
MTPEMMIATAAVVLAVYLFATEKLPVDLSAILLMSLLLLSGVITPEEGIAGFSNPATVTVGAMFVLSAGLLRTGAVNSLGDRLAVLSKKSFWLSLAIIMIPIGLISAFVNNTPAVAVFIPIVMTMAREGGTSPSKLLMPLSFASMFGGTCTLIGTSTNILVGSLAAAHGQRPLGMLEFAPLGLVFFAAGSLYMFTFGIRLIPNRRGGEDLTADFAMKDYLTEIVLHTDAKSVGKPLREAPIVKDLDITIVGMRRNGVSLGLPHADTVILGGDELLVRCNIGKIKKLEEREGVSIKSQMQLRERDLRSEDLMLAEAVVAPNSILVGRSLKKIQFRISFGAIVLALRRGGGKVLRENMNSVPLRAGDALLVEVDHEGYERLRRNRAFVMVSEAPVPRYRRSKIATALLIIAGVIASASVGLLPIVVAAVIGAALMVLTRCLSLEEAYDSIDWKIIFLLAGVLTLGMALEKSGMAALIGNLLVDTVGRLGPVAMLSALYLLTSLLTEMMSNNATAALLVPVAIAGAGALGVDARPFLFAIAFAASASFMTPVGYQTNTMIYAAGQYKFTDFMRVGAPLNVLFWILATLLIPRFWPF